MLKKSVSKLFFFLFLLPSTYANEITAFVVIAPATVIEYSLDGISYSDTLKVEEYSNTRIFVRVIQESLNVSSMSIEINSTLIPLLGEGNQWTGQFMNTYPTGELSINVIIARPMDQRVKIPTTLYIGSSSYLTQILQWVRSFLNFKTT